VVAAAVYVVDLVVARFAPEAVGAVGRAWLTLLLGGLVGTVVAVVAMVLLRVAELRPALAKVSARLPAGLRGRIR